MTDFVYRREIGSFTPSGRKRVTRLDQTHLSIVYPSDGSPFGALIGVLLGPAAFSIENGNCQD